MHCGCLELGCFLPAGIWAVGFTNLTSLTMQSSGAPVGETSALYCQALMTTCSTAGDSAKPLAVTSGQLCVKAYPTSHLVTNRAYTASDYVSEVYSVNPSEICIGVVPYAKSESQSRHVAMHDMTQSKDIPNIDSNNSEYVRFISPSSHSRSHSASMSKTEKVETESPRLRRKQSGSHIATSANNDGVYCEIRDSDSNECCSDLTLSAMPDNSYSAAAWEDIVVERDKLLHRVSLLTIEKQEIVYKLRSFVETNGQLHVELESAHAKIAELQNNIHKIQTTLEQVQHEKALMNARLVELTNLQTLNSNEQNINQEQSPLNIRKQQTSEKAVVNTGNSCLFIK